MNFSRYFFLPSSPQCAWIPFILLFDEILCQYLSHKMYDMHYINIAEVSIADGTRHYITFYECIIVNWTDRLMCCVGGTNENIFTKIKCSFRKHLMFYNFLSLSLSSQNFIIAEKVQFEFSLHCLQTNLI